ncbi:DUF1576 domain-containing protein [Marinilactibacillus sp. XAAS-LB27]|uniref:DUF1576 domain-containing protein n=1 Tax=Marinilactibacillus sp. XAAS-LB27 TaxID=3114538 RepID=UPI002E185E7F|nr:DUF1576 domain-containing protein [Marinilactibacillus sp. XAAS-LB27]
METNDKIVATSARQITQNTQYWMLILFGIFLVLISFVFNTPLEIINGQAVILTTASNLTTDYFELANVGATFFNSGILTLHALLLIKITKAKINGSLIAAVFTVAAFSFFGKNLYNSMPIVVGAFTYAWVTKVPAERSLLAALFGTALGPLVNEITFNIGLRLGIGILLGSAAGFVAGFILPPLAHHFVGFTKGFSLYNIGFSSGVVGTIFTSILRATGVVIEPISLISKGNNMQMSLLFFPLFTVMLLYGLYLNSWSLNGYSRMMKHSGQLSSDFVKKNGFNLTLINMSLLGFVALGFVLSLGGELNGPVIGGVLTVVGFGAFGKHLKNVIPILLGVTLIGYLNNYDMSDTSVIIAGLFGTTIAPIAGRYGLVMGMIAGGLHLTVVSNTSYLHGGINLYNNGFAGGFVAALMIPLLEAVHYHREQRREIREPVDPAESISTEED